MNAELQTIMARLDEVQTLFDETCRTNATLAAEAIDELRNKLAEAVKVIRNWNKKLEADAHKGIVATEKRLTTKCVDVAVKAEKKRAELVATLHSSIDRVETGFAAQVAALAHTADERIDNLGTKLTELINTISTQLGEVVIDSATKLELARKTSEELLTKRMEDFAATAATRRAGLEDRITKLEGGG